MPGSRPERFEPVHLVPRSGELCPGEGVDGE